MLHIRTPGSHIMPIRCYVRTGTSVLYSCGRTPIIAHPASLFVYIMSLDPGHKTPRPCRTRRRPLFSDSQPDPCESDLLVVSAICRLRVSHQQIDANRFHRFMQLVEVVSQDDPDPISCPVWLVTACTSATNLTFKDVMKNTISQPN